MNATELPPGGADGPGADPPEWRVDLDSRNCRTAPVPRGGRRRPRVPAHYGRNRDAFSECFGDLSEVTTGGLGYEFYDRPGRPERALYLVVRHAEELLADAVPRDLGLLVWELRNPRPRYDPPRLWHRYADLRVTFLRAPECLGEFTARLRLADRFRHDGVS